MRNFFSLKKTYAILAGFLMIEACQAADLGDDPKPLDFIKRTAAIKEGAGIADPKIVTHILGYVFEPRPYTVSASNLFATLKQFPRHQERYRRDLQPYEAVLQPILERYGDEVRLAPYRSLERHIAAGRLDLGAIVDYWQNFICSYPIEGYDKEKDKLVREIAYLSEQKELNFDWLEGVILRFAALYSDPSAEERDVFAHVDPAEYEALLDKSVLSNNQLMRASLKDSSKNHFEKTFNIYTMLSYEGLRAPGIHHVPKLIFKHIHPYIRAFFPCYFPGAKVGIEDMMRFWLNDIYPMGFLAPEDHGGDAHGVEFSIFGFLTHDTFHSKDAHYKKRAAFINFFLKTADSYVMDQGWDFESFIEAYAPRAAERYYAVQGVLESLLNLAKRNEKSDVFKPFLAGMFLATHEKNGFDASIFGWGASTSPSAIGKNIVHILTENARKQLASLSAWENPSDPLQTSPVNGHSPLTDKQIVENVIQVFKPEGQIEPEKAHVQRSNRFIDVTIPHKGGATLFKHSQATLYHKQVNANDSLGLLRYAGVKLIHAAGTPILPGLREDRTEVMEYLDIIQKNLHGLLDTFERVGSLYSDRLD